MFEGIAKPMPEPPATIAVLMPMTSPCMLTSGPPELPGLMAASVWMKSSNGPWPMLRALALTMPAVTVACRPKGEPTAMTQSPTCIRSESPSRANLNWPLPSSSLSTARSVFLSRPTTFALCLPPSRVITSISVAFSTTCALVRAIPVASTITPEPRLRCGMRSGASPKNRRKKSSPKNSSNGVRPPPGRPPLEKVLMLMTAGLMTSATPAKLPVFSGICTGSTGAVGVVAGGATRSVRPPAKAPRVTPATSTTASAATNDVLLSCIMGFVPPSGVRHGGVAVEQATEPLAFERLHALELGRGGDQRRFFRCQESADPVVRAIEDSAHLFVDGARGGLAEITLAAEPARFQEERGALAVGGEAEPLGHAVLRDHEARQLAGALEVVVRPRRDLAVDQLLGHAAPEQDGDAVLDLAAGQQEAVFRRQLVRHPQRRDAPRNDGDLVDGIGVRHGGGHERVAHLVVGDDVPLLLGQHAAALLESRHHAVDGFLEIRHLDGVLFLSRGQQRRFVHDVGEVGAREAGRTRGDDGELDVGRQHDGARVQSQDGLAPSDVRLVHHDLAVEAPGAQQRLVSTSGRLVAAMMITPL